jgi:hypothetical protein
MLKGCRRAVPHLSPSFTVPRAMQTVAARRSPHRAQRRTAGVVNIPLTDWADHRSRPCPGHCTAMRSRHRFAPPLPVTATCCPDMRWAATASARQRAPGADSRRITSPRHCQPSSMMGAVSHKSRLRCVLLNVRHAPIATKCHKAKWRDARTYRVAPPQMPLITALRHSGADVAGYSRLMGMGRKGFGELQRLQPAVTLTC